MFIIIVSYWKNILKISIISMDMWISFIEINFLCVFWGHDFSYIKYNVNGLSIITKFSFLFFVVIFLIVFIV